MAARAGVESDNPDAGGRAGGLEPCAMTDNLVWESIECAAGCVYLFNGWVPHRSAANLSNVGRRAVFFTYNPAEEGEVTKILDINNMLNTHTTHKTLAAH